jgi:hypothetical protein
MVLARQALEAAVRNRGMLADLECAEIAKL